jgi:type I restriction enzyme S subunit
MDIKSLAVEGFYSHVLKIPSTWEFAPLHEVIELVGGSQPPKSDFKYEPEEGYVRLIQIRDYKSDDHLVYIPLNKARRFVSPEEVMIGRYGPPIFQILSGLEGAYNVALMKAAPVCDIFTNEYLFKYLSNQDLYNYVNSASDRTAGQSGVNKSHLEKYPVAVPPKAEQKVIADKLDTLLAQVETTKARLDRIPQILKTFRQSVLAAAVSGKLTEEWREKNDCCENTLEQIQKAKKSWTDKNANHNEAARVLKRIKAFNATLNNSPTLPNGWVWGNLEDCVLMIVDCHNKTAPYVEDGIPLIRTSNVRDGQFVWEKLRYVNQETYDFWSKRCPPLSGDIIFTREAPMGEAAIIPKNLRVGLGQRTMLIRPVEKYAPAQYLLLAIMDPQFKKRSEVIAVGTGVKHYRVGDVSNLLIPLPSTEEQTEIVRRVEQLFAYADRIEQQVKAAQQRVDKLTQSILAKAFRGELTAQWRKDNPDLITGDNSAKALLAKIKAERDNLSKKPRKKKQ